MALTSKEVKDLIKFAKSQGLSTLEYSGLKLSFHDSAYYDDLMKMTEHERKAFDPLNGPHPPTSENEELLFASAS